MKSVRIVYPSDTYKDTRTKEQASVLTGLVRGSLGCSDLRTVRNTGTNGQERSLYRRRNVCPRMNLANVGAEWTLRLVRVVAEIEHIVPLRISAKCRVIDLRRDVQWSTALPPTKHPRTKEVCAALNCQVVVGVLYGVVEQVLVELGDELLEVSEGHEGAIESPGWAADGVAVATGEDDTVRHYGLTGENIGSESFDCGLRDTIQKTEVCSKYILIR
jgi:hypothetical protein